MDSDRRKHLLVLAEKAFPVVDAAKALKESQSEADLATLIICLENSICQIYSMGLEDGKMIKSA